MAEGNFPKWIFFCQGRKFTWSKGLSFLVHYQGSRGQDLSGYVRILGSNVRTKSNFQKCQDSDQKVESIRICHYFIGKVKIGKVFPRC